MSPSFRPLRFFLSGLFLFTFFSASPLAAQDLSEAVFRYPLSPELLPRYREINAILSAHPLIKGEFTQKKTLNRLKRSLESGGTFIIDADRGMVWETLRPFPSTMAVGRDYLLQWSPGGRKTRLDARGNETFLQLAETISAVFSGSTEKLLDKFDNYFIEADGTWTVGLVPGEKNLRSFARRIILRGDSVIRQITLYEQNGDTIHYELSGHVFPGALDPRETALFSL
jgi:outer membrane lipoprotein-sorting protein